MNHKIFLTATILIIIFSNLLFAQIKLASIFNDNMVLQSGIEIPVWGFGKPGDVVTVLFNNQKTIGKVDDKGKWSVKLSPEKYGGPYELNVISNDNLTLRNILIGEVWICSGQSNMNMPLAGWGRVNNYKEEIANANYPDIRLCTVPLTIAPKPNGEVKIKGWSECSPATVGSFSAAAYFFGRDIHEVLDVPIGLIHVSKGGTLVESWMSKESLSSNPIYTEKINFVQSGSAEKFLQINKNYEDDYKKWLEYLIKIEPGFDPKDPWYAEEKSYSDWDIMEIPNAWEYGGLGKFDGIVWFKKEIELSKIWLESDLTLNLGAVQDIDITYFNGNKIGKQLKRNHLSTYIVPKNILREGKNVMTVCILDNYGIGGLWDLYDPIELSKSDNEKISLTGGWFYKSSSNLDTLKIKQPTNPRIERYPTILYNGMISPLIPFAMRGVIWYQGESNSKNAYEYRFLFKKMISDWRDKWGEGDFPFLFVQLANYLKRKKYPVEDSWTEIRESQSEVLKLNNTGMAAAIDIGDKIDVHPKNKQEVGRRLALIALANTYNRDISFSGPVYNSHRVVGDTVYISFRYSSDGLLTKDDQEIREFTIAGKDKIFYNANAVIVGNEIAVWNDKVKNPAAVRYAWQANPDVNLYNKSNLPMFTFRTDNWKLSTQK